MSSYKKFRMEKLHSGLMIAAWTTLSILTLFTAYSYKVFPDQQTGSNFFWFQVTFDSLAHTQKQITDLLELAVHYFLHHKHYMYFLGARLEC